jgi:hypothetical protein
MLFRFHTLLILQTINLFLTSPSHSRFIPEKLLFGQPLEQHTHTFDPRLHPSPLDTFPFFKTNFLGCFPSSKEGRCFLESILSSHKNEEITRVDSCLAFCEWKRTRYVVAGVGFQKGCWCLEMMPEYTVDGECDVACGPGENGENDEDMEEICGGKGVLAVLG